MLRVICGVKGRVEKVELLNGGSSVVPLLMIYLRSVLNIEIHTNTNTDRDML